MNNYNCKTIGLDKVKLVQFNLKILNLEKVYEYTSNSEHKRRFIIDGKLNEVGDIYIKDEFFNLKIGVYKKANSSANYQNINLNPSKILYGENINNIYNRDQLLEAIDIVEKRLLDYGIKADIKKSVLDCVEVNTNIILKEEFSKYRNTFEFIQSALPKRLNKNTSHDNRTSGQYTGFKVENSEMSLKFYDKLVEQKITEGFSMLRIEYRFKNRDKVKAIFGFNTMQELIDNFDVISISFKGLIEKDIINASNKKYQKTIYKADERNKNYSKELG